MGQEQAPEKPPCEQEKQDWVAANKRLALKNEELQQLRNFSAARTLSAEVARLEQDVKTKRDRYFQCLQENAEVDL